MEFLRDLVRDLLNDASNTTTLAVAVISLLLGFFLKQCLPFMGRQSRRIFAFISAALGGRLAQRAYERRYLDWLSIEFRELRLPGIVTAELEKRPRLEEVFLSLRLTPTRNDISETLFELINSRLGQRLREGVPRSHLALKKVANRIADTLIEAGQTDPEIVRQVLFKLVLPTSPPPHPPRRLLLTTLFTDVVQAIRYLGSKRGAEKLEKHVLNRLQPSAVLNYFLRSRDRLAILGGPGSGKTTLLHFIGLTYARERASDPSIRQPGILSTRLGTTDWRLPIFIPLASITAHLEPNAGPEKASLIDLAFTLLPSDLQNHPAASRHFRSAIETGRALLLIDGLDEVPGDAAFHSIVDALQGLSAAYPRNKYLITSRETGWRGGVGADFALTFVQDLDDEQVNRFIDTWYDAVERNAVPGRLAEEGKAERASRIRRAAVRTNELKAALRNNQPIRRLAANPMLLSIIALVHRTLATLPRERAKLYGECSKLLLEQWDMSRGIHLDDTGLKLQQKELLLSHLAIGLHRGHFSDGEGGREATFTSLRDKIATLLPLLGRHADDADKLLTRLIERSGLLVERRRGVLAFSHLTFQEYFAAKFLANNDRSDELFLQDRLLNNWWHEVILLYVGLIGDATQFLRRLSLLGDNSVTRPLTRLSGQVLEECTAINDLAVRLDILRALAEVKLRGRRLTDSLLESRPVSDYLTRWASDEEEWLHAALVCSLSKPFGSPSSLALETHLRPLLEGANEKHQLAAVRALTQLRDEESLPIGLRPAITKALSSESARVRAEAISLLNPDDSWESAQLLRTAQSETGELHFSAIGQLLRAKIRTPHIFGELRLLDTTALSRAYMIAAHSQSANAEDLSFHFNLSAAPYLESIPDWAYADLLDQGITMVQESEQYRTIAFQATRNRLIGKDEARHRHALFLLGFVRNPGADVTQASRIMVSNLRKRWVSEAAHRSLVRLSRHWSSEDRAYIKQLAFSGDWSLRVPLLSSLKSFGLVLTDHELGRVEQMIRLQGTKLAVAAVKALAAESPEESLGTRVHGILHEIIERPRKGLLVAALWVVAERGCAAHLPVELIRRCLRSTNSSVRVAASAAIYRSPRFPVDADDLNLLIRRLKRRRSLWLDDLYHRTYRWHLKNSFRRLLSTLGSRSTSPYLWLREDYQIPSELFASLLVVASAARQGCLNIACEDLPEIFSDLILNKEDELLAAATLAVLWRLSAWPVGKDVRWRSLASERGSSREVGQVYRTDFNYHEEAAWLDSRPTALDVSGLLTRTDLAIEGFGGKFQHVLVQRSWQDEIGRTLLDASGPGFAGFLEDLWRYGGPADEEARSALFLRLIQLSRGAGSTEDLSRQLIQVLRLKIDSLLPEALSIAEREIVNGDESKDLLAAARDLLWHKEIHIRERAWRVLAASSTNQASE